MSGRSAAAPAALYLCYFGLREPLVQSQVLPYLRELAAGGRDVVLMTFEPRDRPWNDEEREAWSSSLRADGIEWTRRRYHRNPSLPATLFDVVAGGLAASRIVRRQGIRILHARSHVAAAMAVLARSVTGAKVLFDIRGLLADEYVAGGRWREGGLLYRLVKRAESWLMRGADGIVVLTVKAREAFFPGVVDGRDPRGRPIEVIPTCTDVDRFEAAATQRDDARRELGVEGHNVFVYSGSLGTWYLTDELADFVAAVCAADERAFFVCLTTSPAAVMEERLRTRGVDAGRWLVRRAGPDEMPRLLAAADAGVSFTTAGVSKMASSPTKVGEYLAAGLPVIHTAGVGDVDTMLEHEGVGVVVGSLDRAGYEAARASVERLRASGIAARCRAVAREQFDLRAVGALRYRRIYERLASD